jgi:hypothetical protein
VIGNNMENVRRVDGRTFRTKKMEYLKNKLMRLKQPVRIRILEICAGI